MLRTILFAAAVFASLAAAAIFPTRLAAASEHGSRNEAILTPAPAEPASADYLSHAYLVDQEHQAAAAAAAQAAAAQPPSIQDLIRNAFQPLGDGAVNWAERIAYCESRYDPNAVNSDSDAEGLFQFLPSTWAGTPFASASPFDPWANAQAAAWLLQTYGVDQWECNAVVTSG
ncbi:MAG TPA: transglycosylase SLT domain-containing protein [Candidatus Dormibacteraeota bacterium]